MTRSVDISTEIAAPADAVWAALKQADLIARWFSAAAEGHDDVIRFSWGPDMAWESHVVDLGTNRHLRWDNPDMPIVVDWHLETKGGHTIVRLVQSGLKSGAEWDDEFEAYHAGWRYFLFNLKHYLERHRGVPRGMAWTRRPTQMSRPSVWDRVIGQVQTDGVMRGAVIQESKAPHVFSARLPELNDALLFVELEGKALGVYLSTYGLPTDRVQQLQRWVDDLTLLAT
jgi:uncharacterized protein YndB with AHSA1/START domain